MLGLTEIQVRANRKLYGENIIGPVRPVPWLSIIKDRVKEPVSVSLSLVFLVSVLLGLVTGSWIESVSVGIALLLSISISVFREGRSRKSLEIIDKVTDRDKVSVSRYGGQHIIEIPKADLVVGDYVLLFPGDIVPADIEITKSYSLIVDEWGTETKKVSRSIDSFNWSGPGYPNYNVYRGTRVISGYGEGVVLSVGNDTEEAKRRRSEEIVPKQDKLFSRLRQLSRRIAKIFLIFSLMYLAYVLVSDYLHGHTSIEKILRAIMVSMSVIIVAVPESLGISYVYFFLRRISRDKVLVLEPSGIEALGRVDIVLTSRITSNSYSVDREKTVIHDDRLDRIITNCIVNSGAMISKGGVVSGDPIETCLLEHATSLTGTSPTEALSTYRGSTIIERDPLDPRTLYSRTRITSGDYIKGSPAHVAELIGGDTTWIKEVKEIESTGLKAISFASRIEETGVFEYDGTVYLKPEIIPGTLESIRECYDSGIDIVLVTSDSIETAESIALKAGLERSPKGVWAVTAEEFYTVSWEDGRKFPNVIAEAGPEDKKRIVQEFKKNEADSTIAFIGSDLGDSLAMEESDVPVSLGNGKKALRYASDIVILDDSIKALVSGIKWGRSLYRNIQRFLVFQLTAGLSMALTILLSSIIVGVEAPFRTTQVLWIGVVLGPLAALCLVSENVDPRPLRKKPGNKKNILPMYMLLTALSMGILFFALLIGTILDITRNLNTEFSSDTLFAGFLLINWWSLFNMRVLGRDMSSLDGLLDNKWFLLGMALILISTVIVVEFGGPVFGTTGIAFYDWILLFVPSSSVVIIVESLYQISKEDEN